MRLKASLEIESKNFLATSFFKSMSKLPQFRGPPIIVLRSTVLHNHMRSMFYIMMCNVCPV